MYADVSVNLENAQCGTFNFIYENELDFANQIGSAKQLNR